MQPTRRLWASAALAVGLAVLAVVLARPLPLVGVAFVGVWLLSRQYLFYRASARLADDLTVTQSPGRSWLRTDETVPVTLAATLADTSRLACTVRGGLPTATAAGDQPAIALDPGQTEARETVDVRWPVAGRHAFERASLTVTDGLFEQTLPVGTAPTVTVVPRGPRNVHVGGGGQRLAAAYGEHDTGRGGPGIQPAELREYAPGDTLDQIDWNATARLGTLYAREFEAETDRTTLLVVDHRSSLALGPPEETKLAYLREAALAVLDSARRLGDPLGLLTVGDHGITTQYNASTEHKQCNRIRRTLLDLKPTAATTPSATPLSESLVESWSAPQTASDVQRSLVELGAGNGPFERTVRPFYADRQQYRHHVDSNPLYRALERRLRDERSPVFTVLCTDDSAPAEVRETVRLTRQEGGQLLVFLAPTVLYERGGLADLEQAYDRYVEFEEFRRDLAGLEGVTALEVGPGDRLTTVLAAGKRRRQYAGGGRE